MKIALLLLGLCVCVLGGPLAAPAPAAKGKRLSDEDMYHQMAAFVDAHQHIPADAKLVENILASAKWAELHAQFGPQSPGKKMTTTAERKKPMHK